MFLDLDPYSDQCSNLTAEGSRRNEMSEIIYEAQQVLLSKRLEAIQLNLGLCLNGANNQPYHLAIREHYFLSDTVNIKVW